MSPTRACWAVETIFIENALEGRKPYRAEHLDRIRTLMAEGRCLMAGAFDDMKGALLVFAVETEAEAIRLIEEDVYWQRGIWTSHRARKLNRVVPADEG